ncbi:MAG: tetratricopeptide repeat protein [Gemmataceae bacterium]
MKLLYFGLFAGLLFLIPGLAMTQESQQIKLTDEATRQLKQGVQLTNEAALQYLGPVRVVDPAKKKMYEDIEILRRILNEKLNLPRASVDPMVQYGNFFSTQEGSLGGFGGGGFLGGMSGSASSGAMPPAMGMSGMQPSGGAIGGGGGIVGNPSMGSGMMGGGAGVNTRNPLVGEHPGAEGAYLKGYGVVYTLTLPPQPLGRPRETKPAPKPISEWDRIRKEMNGEKVDTDARPSLHAEPSVTEKILKILAENGHRFTQLGDNEKLSVVITFRSSQQMAGGNPFLTRFIDGGSVLEAGGANSNAGLNGNLNVSNQDVSQQFQPQGGDSGGKGAQQAPGATRQGSETGGSNPIGGNNSLTPSAKDNLLLGDLQMKQGNYKDAAGAYKSALKLLSDQKDSPQRAEILKKLAQVQVANGQFDEAKQLLDQIVKHKNVAPTNSKKETSKAAPLPGKLIISAPKSLLDQIGNGKIDFDTFAKAVSVEQEDFTAAGNKAVSVELGDFTADGNN